MTAGRDVKSVTGLIGGSPVRVSTTHLESPMGGPRQVYCKERGEQMREMLGLLEGAPEANVVAAGAPWGLARLWAALCGGLCVWCMTVVWVLRCLVAAALFACSKIVFLLCLLAMCTLSSLPTGDMNWIPLDSQEHALPLPAGWVDVWLALRQDSVGWTFDSARCYQKGHKYGRGVSIWQQGELELLAV